MSDGGTMYPALRYTDATRAIDWLVDAFGFEKHAVFTTDDGKVAHAELRLGNGMIMLGEARADEFNWKSPAEAGCVTQTIYSYVDDADAHYERARRAGAQIVREVQDTPYGTREYSARDLDGHLWSFGTYRAG